MIRIQGKSHVGGRKHNEDRFVADEGWGIALVSDGMGGAEAGEVAAGIVAAGMVDRLDAGMPLAEAVVEANEEVKQSPGKGRGIAGMGATLVIACFHDHVYQLAWIGDSRIYLWDGELRQLTRDHSKLELMLESSELTLEEVDNYPDSHVITRAMGLSEFAVGEVPTLRGTLCRGQQLLLCSDGITDALSPTRIASILAAGDSPDETLTRLVESALAEAGDRADNITAVLASADDEAPQSTGVSMLPVVSIARPDGYYRYFSANERRDSA